MTEQPRYATLRDYVAMLRRQRWVVLLVTAVFVVVAIGLSMAQTPVYRSEASVSFRDISQDLRVLGVEAAPELSSEQRAGQSAEAIVRESVAKRVARELDEAYDLTPEQVLASVNTQVASLNALVLIEANADDPEQAARIANAFAEEAVKEADREQQERLEPVIRDLRDQVDEGDETPSVAEQLAALQLTRLETLSDIARGADIVVRAEPAAAPVSPRPARNAVIGGLLGLALGVLAAFLRDSLDRRIRAAKDVYEELGYPVVGRVGASALGLAANSGAPAMLPADVEAFRMLRANLAIFNRESVVRSVLVTSGLPEEGKTTVAAALARAAALTGQRVLLVDADLRRPMLASRLGINSAPGLAEYLNGEVDPREILQVKPLSVAHASGNGLGADARAGEGPDRGPSLVVIAAGRLTAQAAELLSTQRCKVFLDKVSKAYDLVVIDSGPLLSSADPLQLSPHVDAVLVCVRAGSSTRDEIRAVKQALGRLSDAQVGTVVTGIGHSDPEYGYYGYEFAK